VFLLSLSILSYPCGPSRCDLSCATVDGHPRPPRQASDSSIARGREDSTGGPLPRLVAGPDRSLLGASRSFGGP